MKIDIKRYDNREVIHSGEFHSLKACLEDGISKGVSFAYADLSGTDLSYADFKWVNFNWADLSGTDLNHVNLSQTDLRGVDLDRTKGIYIFNAYDTSKRTVYCVKHDDTFMCKAGCFYGDLDELEAKVLASHKSKVYLGNIAIMRELLKDKPE